MLWLSYGLTDLVRRCEYSDMLRACLLNLGEILANIPEEWRYLDGDMLLPSDHLSDAQIHTTLTRYETDPFWIE